MLSERTRAALIDILDNIVLAHNFIEGFDLVRFRNDRKTVYAVVRCLEIISEASRKVDEDVKLRHAHLPWRAIADSGNVYRHVYDNVAEDLIWKTVRDRLTDLRTMAEIELG